MSETKNFDPNEYIEPWRSTENELDMRFTEKLNFDGHKKAKDLLYDQLEKKYKIDFQNDNQEDLRQFYLDSKDKEILKEQLEEIRLHANSQRYYLDIKDQKNENDSEYRKLLNTEGQKLIYIMEGEDTWYPGVNSPRNYTSNDGSFPGLK